MKNRAQKHARLTIGAAIERRVSTTTHCPGCSPAASQLHHHLDVPEVRIVAVLGTNDVSVELQGPEFVLRQTAGIERRTDRGEMLAQEQETEQEQRQEQRLPTS